MIAFAIAGALTAIGGILLAPTVPVTYNADLSITINGFAAAVFGGFASIRLAFLGGYALGDRRAARRRATSTRSTTSSSRSP